MIIHPTLLGTFTLYAILLSACAAFGLLLSRLLGGKDRAFLIDGGIVVVLLSLIGSRVSFIFRNFSYFKTHLLEIPQFWLGGLSWPGALLGAAVGILLVHWIWKEPLNELLDNYLPLFGLVAMGIWVAGWGVGTGYGGTTSAWFGIPVRDIFGLVERRWPLPIMGAVLSGGWIAAVIFLPLKRGRKAGFRGMLGIAGLLFLNGVGSFFRVDPAPVLWGFRIESWISLAFLILFLVYFYMMREKDENESIAP